MALDALLVLQVRVDIAPAFLRQEREFIVADLARTIRVHEAVQLLNVIEADLETEEIDSLRKLVD